MELDKLDTASYCRGQGRFCAGSQVGVWESANVNQRSGSWTGHVYLSEMFCAC